MELNRRDFLRISGTFSLSLTAGCAFAADNKGNLKGSRPNLLIIHTDEHNFRTLGCYRKTLPAKQAFVWGEDVVVETPNIDWLAQNGTLCTSFYATTPVCSPSRGALVSGRYPQNTPVITNDIPLNDNIITFAHILANNGYKTGYAGKWHLDGLGKPQWAPTRQFGFNDNRYMFNRGHWKQLEDTKDGPRIAARKNGKASYSIEGANRKNFTTDFLADKTIDFLRTNKNEPFCYMVSIPDPHGPNSVRPPYDTMYTHLDFQKPATETAAKSQQDLPSWATPAKRTISKDGMAKYFGMVKCIDDNVGRIIDELKKLGLIDNTIVIFTSDHGDLCGEHGKDNKGNPFEASAKVPFIMSYKPKVKVGNVINEALSCVDFLPTVLSIMNIKTAGKEQGRDASALFIDGNAPAGWTDIAFMRGTGQRNGKDDGNWLCAVTSRYKLVYSPQDKPWLFDLQKDPDEMINMYDKPEYKSILKQLAAQLLTYGSKYNDPRINVPSIRAELKRLTQ